MSNTSEYENFIKMLVRGYTVRWGRKPTPSQVSAIRRLLDKVLEGIQSLQFYWNLDLDELTTFLEDF